MFDPYEREVDVLERQLSQGQLTREEFEDAILDLQRDAAEEARQEVENTYRYYEYQPEEQW